MRKEGEVAAKQVELPALHLTSNRAALFLSDLCTGEGKIDNILFGGKTHIFIAKNKIENY